MKKSTKILVIMSCLVFVGLVFVPLVAEATNVSVVKLQNPLGTTNIPQIIGGFIARLLALIGSIALLMFIIGGFMWLTSAGNPEKIQKGIQTMIWSAIGVFIIFSSYAILQLILKGLSVESYADAPNPFTVEEGVDGTSSEGKQGCYCIFKEDEEAGEKKVTAPVKQGDCTDYAEAAKETIKSCKWYETASAAAATEKQSECQKNYSKFGLSCNTKTTCDKSSESKSKIKSAWAEKSKPHKNSKKKSYFITWQCLGQPTNVVCCVKKP